MYESLRIINRLKPKYVIWENVKAVISKKHKHNFDNYLLAMEKIGYTNYYQVLNAKDYGVPQNRERVFTVSIRGEHTPFNFPVLVPLTVRLKDLLEPTVDEKYYLSEERVKYMKVTNFNTSRYENRVNDPDGVTHILMARDYKDPQCIKVGDLDIKGMDCIKRVYSPKGLSPTLTTMSGGNTEPKIVDIIEPMTIGSNCHKITEYPRAITACGDKGKKQMSSSSLAYTLAANPSSDCTPRITEAPYRVRKLTPRECWRLMGFDDKDFDKASKVNSNSQLYKQAGNSIVVKVLEGIVKQLLTAN